MKRAGGLAALLLGLGWVAGVPAQRPALPVPAAGVPVRAGVGFSIAGRVSPFSVYLGTPGPGLYPRFWGGPGWGYHVGGRSFASITIIAPPLVAPPIIVAVPPAEPVFRDPIIVDPVIIRPRHRQPAEPPAERPEKPLPGGEAAGGFRPIRPENRARAQMPAPPEKPAPMPPQPPKVEPPREPPLPPRPMLPDPDPKIEHARLMALGRDSFANQQYGRAARRFRQATAVLPDEPLAHFLLAQAELAVGKFREAVAAIHAGMRLQPDWPTVRFQPLNLYGTNVADYSEHLARLEETLARHPDDPVLLFLYAYQLWFDGRQDEARPLFRRAVPLVADPSFIRRFLQDDLVV